MSQKNISSKPKVQQKSDKQDKGQTLFAKQRRKYILNMKTPKSGELDRMHTIAFEEY